jgi:hypothetical protein
MQIIADQIDDLKTDRKDIMPALPMVFRMVPILFYGALAFLVVIGSLAFWNMRVATQKRGVVKNSALRLSQLVVARSLPFLMSSSDTPKNVPARWSKAPVSFPSYSGRNCSFPLWM